MNTLRQAAWRRFRGDTLAVVVAVGVGAMLAVALLAPFLANGRPLLAQEPDGAWCMPFLRTFFAPDSPEYFIEQAFNYLLLLLPAAGVCRLVSRKYWKRFALAAAVLLDLVRQDKTV